MGRLWTRLFHEVNKRCEDSKLWELLGKLSHPLSPPLFFSPLFFPLLFPLSFSLFLSSLFSCSLFISFLLVVNPMLDQSLMLLFLTKMIATQDRNLHRGSPSIRYHNKYLSISLSLYFLFFFFFFLYFFLYFFLLFFWVCPYFYQLD